MRVKAVAEFFPVERTSQDLIGRSDYILPESVQLCRLYQINWRENEKSSIVRSEIRNTSSADKGKSAVQGFSS